MENKRKLLLGVPFDICRKEEFYLRIERELQGSGGKTIFAVNPEKIMRAKKDMDLFSVLEEADYLVPDGIGIIIGTWILHGIRISRVTGIELVEYLLKIANLGNSRVFIFGAKPFISKLASEKILRKYPLLNLVGMQHGYLPNREYKNLVNRINDLRTDILFVALGSPKQEKWINKYKKSLKTKICIGIGGSLDVYSGITERAPIWVQKIGLEWLSRLFKEPTRIKRQMILPIFSFEILKEKMFS